MSLAQIESLQGLPKEAAVYKKVYETAKAYFVLTKPRIISLLLFTAYCGMIAAQGRFPSIEKTFVLLFGLALCTGGAAVINMWYDRDIDAVMQRTSGRPIPRGRVKPEHALWFGIGLGIASIIVIGVWINWLTAALSVAGYLYYACVYTMWLKRRTPQNIVIGGGAGAFPPLIGWTAVTGHISLAAILMFAVILLWTPSHFWSLALYKNRDYKRAGVPMMPVVRGARATKQQMVIYSMLLMIVSLLYPLTVEVSSIYSWGAAVLGVLFLFCNLYVLWEPDNQYVWAKRTFKASLLYLPALFIMMVICTLG